MSLDDPLVELETDKVTQEVPSPITGVLGEILMRDGDDALPGDVLEYHMQKLNQRRGMYWFRGEAKVAGQIVAEAELGAMISDG